MAAWLHLRKPSQGVPLCSCPDRPADLIPGIQDSQQVPTEPWGRAKGHGSPERFQMVVGWGCFCHLRDDYEYVIGKCRNGNEIRRAERGLTDGRQASPVEDEWGLRPVPRSPDTPSPGRNRVSWKELDRRSQTDLQTRVQILAPLVSSGTWGHYLISLRFSYLIYNMGGANGGKCLAQIPSMFLLCVCSQQRLATYHLFSSHLLIGPFFMRRISGLPSLPEGGLAWPSLYQAFGLGNNGVGLSGGKRSQFSTSPAQRHDARQGGREERESESTSRLLLLLVGSHLVPQSQKSKPSQPQPVSCDPELTLLWGQEGDAGSEAEGNVWTFETDHASSKNVTLPLAGVIRGETKSQSRKYRDFFIKAKASGLIGW